MIPRRRTFMPRPTSGWKLNRKGRPEPPFNHLGFRSYERFLELRY
ncbi:hypothetical protein T190_26930 [Sinorhizobium meliloti CCBAU 01290]|nr:hypothetical protein T190_26930 [Sinorhizobium meliloti CCBAU 01290]